VNKLRCNSNVERAEPLNSLDFGAVNPKEKGWKHEALRWDGILKPQEMPCVTGSQGSMDGIGGFR